MNHLIKSGGFIYAAKMAKVGTPVLKMPDFAIFLNFTNNIIIPNKINNDIIITENGNQII